jgi:hypothetical protein
MKRKVLLFTALTGFLLSGCRPGTAEEIPDTASRLIAKSANLETTTRSATGESSETVVFTGDDILWFNETTKELRFKNNMSLNESISLVHGNGIKFYIDDEYLFSSMRGISDVSSQTVNRPVFYYSAIENRFYLADGYPPVTDYLSDPEAAQAERDENMRMIANEWNRFIEQMKKEERYKN